MIPVAAEQWQVRGQSPAPLLGVGTMLAVAVLAQSLLIPVDADVSWLISLCERVLAGDRLYVDLLEANPPASVWLYLPAVWLAQRAGVPPEPVVIGFAVLGALLSVWMTAALSARSPSRLASGWLVLAIAFALLILPGGLFAQREHFALMLAFPAAAAIALLAERVSPGPAALLGAGVAAGLTIVIKPPFVLAVALPALWALSRARRLRPFLLPAVAASAIVGLYAAAVLVFAPGYLGVIPMLAATYLPMHEGAPGFLLGPMLTVPAGFYLLGRIVHSQRMPPLAMALFFATGGFALAGLTQGKNYLNHSYPGIALAAAACALLLGARWRNGASGLPAIAVAALLAGIPLKATMSVQPPGGLVDAIGRSGPPEPTLLTLGTELATGHPATRLAGGHWVGSRAALFTAAGARFAGLADPAARRWYRGDLDSFVADVAANRPDLILVEDGARSWLLADPAIRRAVADYAPVDRAGAVELWRRR